MNNMLTIKQILIALSCVAGNLACAQTLDKVKPLPVSKEYWKSEAFRKSFNGSYRINARVEPFVDTKERGLLVEIQELMAKEQRTNALNKLKASSLIKTSASIMFNAGNLAYESGDLKYAEQQFSAAIKKFPSFLRAHQNLAVVYSQQDQYDKAYPHLLETVRLGTQDGMVMGLLGYCYQQKKNYTSALQAFRNAQLTDANNLEWKRGEAYCHVQLGAHAKALNLYEEIVKARPNEHINTLLLVNLYQRMGRGEDAIVNLELLRRKGVLEEMDKALLGELHMRYGSRKLGAEVIREALNSGKLKEADVALNTVKFSLERNDIVLAKEFYGLIKTEILGNELHKTNYKRLGAWVSLRDSEVTEKKAAKEILRALIKSNPLDADSLFLLAWQEAIDDNKEEALLLYQQGSRGEGEFKSRSLLEKGKLLVGLKRYQDALKSLTVYAKIDPSKSVKDYIKAVKSLAEASQ